MAYTKQTWLDRVGTFLNRFKKSNETLSSVELVNDPGTITQAGTAFSAIRMNYMEAGIEAAHRIATPLSDLSRVMRINGDGVPMFPDNVAGRTYWQDEWATNDGWDAFRSTLSVSGGSLIITLTALYGTASKSISVTSGKLITAIVKSSYSGIMQLRGTIDGVNDIVLDSVSVVAGVPARVSVTLPGALTYLYIMHVTAPAGSVLELDTIYIGSGLYDTPVYGKDGQTVAVNHGAVPVNGKRGRGLLFQGRGAMPLVFNEPVIGSTGTIRFKFKTSDTYIGGYYFGNTAYPAGLSLYQNDSGETDLKGFSIGDLAVNTEYTYSFYFSLTNLYVYRNGSLLFTYTLTTPLAISPSNLYISRNSESASGQNFTLYDFEYVAEPETLDAHIRFMNGDDAVDSQQKSITGTPHAIAVFGSDGKLHATATEANHATTAAACTGNAATATIANDILSTPIFTARGIKIAYAGESLSYASISGKFVTLYGCLMNRTDLTVTTIFKTSIDEGSPYIVPNGCYLFYTYKVSS